MAYFVLALAGLIAGAFCMFIGLERRRRQVATDLAQVQYRSSHINEMIADLAGREQKFESLRKHQHADLEEKLANAKKKLQERAATLDLLRLQLQNERDEQEQKLNEQCRLRQMEIDESCARARAQIEEQEREAARAFEARLKQIESERGAFESQIVQYSMLAAENESLKRGLRKLLITNRKCQLDSRKLGARQIEIASRVDELASRYLSDHVKWISKTLNANNYASCKQKLVDVIERCRGIGFDISGAQEEGYIANLRAEYEQEVRAALQREEQARIKAQIRAEEQREREIQRELDRIERERSVLATALEKALAESLDQHSTEIESLRRRLEEAESKQRAISQAQITKAGFLYVISNVGSFGEGVFKVGMTRRLVPQDRVKELGDASVPFPFDVHMMISCDNAPALENAIHRRLLHCQVNKTNPRKEFFRTDVETIASIVKEHRGDVEYTADAEALQYRQSLTMSPDDQEFVERVFDEAEDELGVSADELSYPVE